MRIVADNKKCTGCLACVVTCVDHHYAADAPYPLAARGYKRMVKESGLTQYVTYSCHHCEDAPCISACPCSAIQKDKNGWVRVEESLCIGCMACAKVCPHDIPRLREDGKMVKCDGCGGEPNCVKICPCGALTIGE